MKKTKKLTKKEISKIAKLEKLLHFKEKERRLQERNETYKEVVEWNINE